MSHSSSFSDLRLSTSLLLALEATGYDEPTPVQKTVIPHVLNRHDVMVMAKTGSGKTAAFCLPLLQLLLPYANKSLSPALHPVQALVLTPTRELTQQISQHLMIYAQMTDLRSIAIVGGTDMNAQITQLRSGIEVVIATVGRLLDLLRNKAIDLEHVRFLVLDEADRMLDMGFLPDLTEILRVLPSKRQNMLFSATLTPDIRKLANAYLRNPVTLNISKDIEISDTIKHVVCFCSDDHKQKILLKLLNERNGQQAIVFLNIKRQTRTLADHINRCHIKAEALHGDLSQFERNLVLKRFRDKEIQILVATDVAARGLDIPALPLVVNYAPPLSSVEYVHRVGRTGRAGLGGEAITLCTSDEKTYLLEIEKLLEQKIPMLSVVPSALQNQHSSISPSHHHDRLEAVHHTKNRTPKTTPPIPPQNTLHATNQSIEARPIMSPDSAKNKKKLPALLRYTNITNSACN